MRKLRTLAIAPVLVDDSPNESGVLPTADGGLDALKHAEVVIKTPGISPYGPAAAELRAAGVTLVGGLSLWANEADLSRVVYVTGTKGKSTTSSVIGHCCAASAARPWSAATSAPRPMTRSTAATTTTG